MAFDQEDDNIEADVAAAFKAAEEPEGVVASPAQTAPVETPPEPQDERVRGPDGKFAKAPETVQDTPQEQPETPQESIRPPAAWSASAKAMFQTLDPVVQAEVVKRERDMDKGLQERATQLKRYEPVESVLAPIRDRLALAGTDDATYLRSLVAADEMLRTNPQDALRQIAQMYGIPFGAQAQGQPQAQPDPASFSGLNIQTHVQQAVAQAVQQQTEQAQRAQTLSQIEAFANDPNNLYFENVRPIMSGLLQSGKATDLATAYEQAIWADPEIRPILLREQAKAEEAKRTEAIKLKAAQAKNASGSVAGSGGHGSPVTTSNPTSTIEDDVRAAMAAAESRI